jgi:mannose-6-phosphate isomerase
MTFEHAATTRVAKPWGVTDLRPWSAIEAAGERIGEVWFQRAENTAVVPALLVKLLFTSAPLSIQVHPDDEFARSTGLPHGKTEAWYILEARPGARVAMGLQQPLTPEELRAAISDGAIAGLVRWIPAAKGDIFFIAGGTIHAIGAGIVLAEIQQRSDTTFRLFDHGSPRELHEDGAVAASHTGPLRTGGARRRLDATREILVTSTHFVMERIDLPAHSRWTLQAERETWILAIAGGGRMGSTDAGVGDAIFAEADRAAVSVGPYGMSCVIAYPGPGVATALLQQSADETNTTAARCPQKIVEVQT